MKIDLHVHTIKVHNKDTSNRNIKSVSDFCDQMENSNVGIVAITNHNYFDFNQYSEIIKEVSNRKQPLMVIPGIEVDVKINENRRQLNVLFSPNDVNDGLKKFYDHFIDEFETINSRDNKNNALEWNIFEHFFLKNDAINSKIILYIDSKKISNANSSKNSTSFSNEEVEKLFGELNKRENICVLRDVNKELDFDYFMYWNENSLIGSDNLDWENYIDNSSKLLEYNLVISDFDDLFTVFKNKSTYDVFDRFKLLKIFNELEVEKNKKYKLNNIKIVEGATNIIFGPKATGKTSLLEAISDKVQSSNTYIYKPNNKLIFLNNYKNEKYFELERNIFNEEFNKILEFQEYKNDNKPSDFYNFFNSKVKQNLFPFIANYEEDILLLDYEKISKLIVDSIDNLKGYIHKVNNIKNSINNINYNDEEYLDYYEDKVKEIIENNINKWISFKRKIFINTINKSLVTKFSEILRIYKNTIKKPNSIGLLQLFNKRLFFYKILLNLKKMFDKKNNLYSIETFHIPNNDGTEKIIHLKYKLIYFYNDKPSSKYSKILNLFFEQYISNKKFVDVTKWIINLKEIYKDNFIDSKDEGKNFVFFHNDKEIKISNGERHFLNLYHYLNINRDYYFLDEPETSLNNIFISKIIIQKLIDLNKSKKTVVMTTHNNILGMNSRAMNFIFRDNKKSNYNDVFNTLIGNIQEVYLYDTFNNKKTDIDIREELFKIFEGDEIKYKYRRKIYGVN